jgi:hypothetical protein
MDQLTGKYNIIVNIVEASTKIFINVIHTCTYMSYKHTHMSLCLCLSLSHTHTPVFQSLDRNWFPGDHSLIKDQRNVPSNRRYATLKT